MISRENGQRLTNRSKAPIVTTPLNWSTIPMKNLIQPVRGTRDFYPASMSFRRWLYESLGTVSALFGYQEYEGPILERLELYAAKSGDELVKEQAFVFKDRGGDEITLRPELTPSLARMVAAKHAQLPKPIRWWSFGPMWRYERPQKGRSREFFQWNLDLLGVDSAEADAEVIAIAATFFQRMGLSPSEIQIHVNDRRLMEREVLKLGIAGDQLKLVYKLIDRVDKLERPRWREYAVELAQLSVAQIEQLEALIAHTTLWEQAPELQRLMQALSVLGLREYVTFDPTIIRGLEYYTGTVFEARDTSGEFRAILGGGHYGNLVADVGGGEALSGVGFGMGDMVVELLLRKYLKVPELNPSPTKVLVTVFSAELAQASAALATELRAQGLPTELTPNSIKLDKQLKYANAHAIPWVAIIGPDELNSGHVVLKDLKAGTQQTVARSEVVGFLNIKATSRR